jgi:hypothetical protein
MAANLSAGFLDLFVEQLERFADVAGFDFFEVPAETSDFLSRFRYCTADATAGRRVLSGGECGRRR